MQDNSERSLMEPALLKRGESEIRDISLGTFRFLSVLFAAALVLMIAGVI